MKKYSIKNIADLKIKNCIRLMYVYAKRLWLYEKNILFR